MSDHLAEAQRALDELVAQRRAEKAASPRTLAELTARFHQRQAAILREDAADARALADHPDTADAARAPLRQRAVWNEAWARSHDDSVAMAGG